MGFPFLAPLKEWTTEKIEAREKNREELNTLMPFVILSSAAVVTKTPKNADEIKAIYDSGNYDSFSYKGCVIANSTDILKNYQLGKTLAGYDLDGKPIEVEGETNRRVSMPIIESVEIDTDGGNNTLKTASIKIKVFTLKQLEMFELFFLRPSMRLVLEYGWNVQIRERLDITTRMFANKSHTEYLAKYSKIFSRENNAYKDAKTAYIDTLRDTKGNYDFMAGQVSNFSYSPQSDGTFDVSLEISAGNELQLWMPVKQSKKSDKSDAKGDAKEPKPYQTWVNKLAADLNSPKFVQELANETEWKPEFFNWGAINVTQKDTTFSKDAYISMKLILYLLNNMKIFSESKETIRTLYFEDALGEKSKKPIIPVSSNYLIISSTKDFILPGKLPAILVSKDDKKADVIKLDPEAAREDCLISERKFNVSDAKEITEYTIYDVSGNEIKTTSSIGNLYNVYFKYDAFVSAYNGAYTSADIVNSLLDTINSNMYGLCKLELQAESDVPGSPLIISDRKLKIPQPTQKIQEIFRFKVGALNSIVKEFSFNMELSTLMQAQALYSSQLAIQSATNKDKSNNGSKVPEKDPYQHANLSYAKNSDDYYSINALEIQIVKQANSWNKIIEETANVAKEDPKKKDGEEEAQNLAEVRNKNYVRFKQNPDSKTEPVKNYIYTDPALIQNHINPTDVKKQGTALTYLDISLSIDGMAGISCGEYFHIDGVPEIYNKNGYFQVTNVKQGISNAGWQTTIEAGYRINVKEE
jgi:hypothetical protein